MGGSARFLMLLTTPYPFLIPRPSFLIRLARNSRSLTSILPSLNPNKSTRTLISFTPIRAIQSENFHSQSNVFQDETFTNQFGSAGGSVSTPNWYHPWPEWSRFLEHVRQSGYFERVVDGDAWGFVSGDNCSSTEFYKAALACLEFALDRDNLLGYLSRSDIRVVVENGSAYLFRDAEMLRIKMKGLFGVTDSGVTNLERPTMVDLMKFLISSANIHPVSYPDGNHGNEQVVVASVRNLLSELANVNFNSTQTHYSDRYGQPPTPRGQQIEMKKGDWICPKCTFMNFARNMKCLECDEARPRRQLTNGEWECPQCDFFNYGRNMVCLRCDCKRPGETSQLTSSLNHPQSTNWNSGRTSIQQAANQNVQWSSGNESNQRVLDDEFPEIMPLRKGVNRFVVSTRKTPLERRLANTQSDNDDASARINNSNSYGHVPFVPLPPDMFSTKPQNDIKAIEEEQTNVSRYSQGGGDAYNQAEFSNDIPDEDFPELMPPMRKGENRFVVTKKNDRSLTTPVNKRQAAMEQASESKFAPFVPFPPDYFAKKDHSQPEPFKSSQTSTEEIRGNGAHDIKDGYIERSSSTHTDLPTNVSANIQKSNTNTRDRWSGKSLEGSAVTETDPLDMSEEAKAERWFRRAAQIKDISELSQIPDEDFPSIMPMRKGVNRFVVSKRKTPLERRLTSPQYRRNLPVVESDSTETSNDRD